MKLKDSVAIVTGGGNGIGEAIVKHFVKNGTKVVVVDMSQSNIDRVVKEVKAMGGEVIGVQATSPARPTRQSISRQRLMPLAN